MTLEEYKALREFMLTLRKQARQLDEIHQKVNKQTWLSDFSSNVAGNAAWDGLIWLVKFLTKR